MRVEGGRCRGAVILVGLAWLLAAGMAPADEKKEEKETTVTEPFGVQVEIPDWKPELAEELLRETANDILAVLDYRDDKGCGPGSKIYFLRGVKEEHKSCFSKIEDGTVKKLELALDSRPGSGWVLYVYGVQIREGKREPNPDVGAVQLGVEPDVAEKEQRRQDAAEQEAAKKAQLGLDEDKHYIYQLSHVQADRALALLKSLGYEVVEFLEEKDPKIPFNKIFKGESTAGAKSRPAIVSLIDSVRTSLVGVGSGGGGGDDPDDPLQLGGQKLEDMTTGDPQQRLLIIWQEGSDGEGRKDLTKLLRLLREEIDVPSRQILIEAMVIELDKDKLREIGVAFEGSKDGRSVEFQESDAGLQLPLIATFTRPAAQTVFEFTARIKALIDQGEARVLSRPSVLVLDGRQARIQVGDKIPYTSKLDATQAGILAQTTYLGVGIVLNLRPRASLDNSEVTMQVETLISSAGPSFVQPQTGVLVAPPIRSREVQTLVRVANDTPFIIGGLISATEQTSNVGVPGLSKIPLLGRLFRKEVKIDDSKEVIVVITPHIVPLDDRAFTYTIPKGSDIFDSFGRTLFRNIYRVRAEDVWGELTFIRESAFYHCLTALVLRDARAAVEWPPSGGPSGPCPRYEPPPDLDALVERVEEKAREDPDFNPSSAYMTLLRGGVPGEDILVRRMLLGLVEDQEFGKLVKTQNILFYEGAAEEVDEKAEDEIADCPGEERSEAQGAEPAAATELDTIYLKDRLGPSRLLDWECKESVVLSFPSKRVAIDVLDKTRDEPAMFSAKLAALAEDFRDPLDPPKAVVCKESVEDACLERKGGMRVRERCYVDSLRGLNADGEEFGILLNECFSRRDFTSLGFLKNVLVLRRLLELNPTLPLTLRGFHVGREIVFPAEDEVERSEYQVDRKAAQLFYEAMDYYKAFESEMRRAARLSTDLERLFSSLTNPPEAQQ